MDKFEKFEKDLISEMIAVIKTPKDAEKVAQKLATALSSIMCAAAYKGPKAAETTVMVCESRKSSTTETRLILVEGIVHDVMMELSETSFGRAILDRHTNNGTDGDDVDEDEEHDVAGYAASQNDDPTGRTH